MGGRFDGWVMLATLAVIVLGMIVCGVRLIAPPALADANEDEKLTEHSSDKTTVALEQREPAPAPLDPVEKLLAQPISVEYVQMPLQELLEAFGEKVGCSIIVTRKELEEASVALDTLITFHARNAVAETVLRGILQNHNLTLILDGNSVIITTQEDATQELQLRIYDCRDFPNLAQPAGSFEKGRTPPPGGGQSRAANHPNSQRPVVLITNVVAPQSWGDAGGPGSIDDYHGMLVVGQTQDVHRKIESMLTAIRRIGGLKPEKVRVERWYGSN